MEYSKQADTSPVLSPEEAAVLYESTPVDIAIIGGGPAGFSSAINGRTRGRSTVILSGDYHDSPLYKASIVENMPGLPGRSGAELLDYFHNHAMQLGAVHLKGRALVVMETDFGTSNKDHKPGFQIAYGSNFLMARTVIITTGVASAVPYPGEEKFLGKGVSYCATCDGMLYRGRNVAVIAKSSDAVEEALHLCKIGCKVTLFVSPADLKRWNITLPDNTFVRIINASRFAVEGDDYVTYLVADDEKIPFSGVFILRSTIALSSLLAGLELDNNYIRTAKNQSTNIPGVFAAGDCTGKPLQIAKSLGEGLIAALSADAYLTALEASETAHTSEKPVNL
jgi:thioredoxin reductase (NADPH)